MRVGIDETGHQRPAAKVALGGTLAGSIATIFERTDGEDAPIEQGDCLNALLVGHRQDRAAGDYRLLVHWRQRYRVFPALAGSGRAGLARSSQSAQHEIEQATNQHSRLIAEPPAYSEVSWNDAEPGEGIKICCQRTADWCVGKWE